NQPATMDQGRTTRRGRCPEDNARPGCEVQCGEGEAPGSCLNGWRASRRGIGNGSGHDAPLPDRIDIHVTKKDVLICGRILSAAVGPGLRHEVCRRYSIRALWINRVRIWWSRETH